MPVAKGGQQDIWDGDFMLKGSACYIIVQAQMFGGDLSMCFSSGVRRRR